MTKKKRTVVPVLLAMALTLCFGQSVLAQEDWKFGIGTGFTSFSLDGDIGFVTPAGGVIFDVDLDNSDTADMFDSALGLGGFASKGKWKILAQAATLTLEDSDGGLAADWERTQLEVAGVYTFARPGDHAWGVLFGVRSIKHDWEITTSSASVDFDEDWTDALVGITYAFRFADRWSWSNRLDGGFGDSEGSYLLISAINWQAAEHWAFNFNIRQHSIEFGEPEDIADPDFYLYDVDEPGVGVGFMFTW